MPTMLSPKFRRAHMGAVGRPSPRAADLTPEQQQQLRDAAGQIGGAIVDTIKGITQPQPPPAPAAPAKADHTALFVLVAVVGIGAFLVLRK